MVIIELTDVGLYTLVCLLMVVDIAALGKCLSVDIVGEGLLVIMAAHICLKVALLGESKAIVLLVVGIGLSASIHTVVNI